MITLSAESIEAEDCDAASARTGRQRRVVGLLKEISDAPEDSASKVDARSNFEPDGLD
jgi:hypothetical protein